MTPAELTQLEELARKASPQYWIDKGYFKIEKIKDIELRTYPAPSDPRAKEIIEVGRAFADAANPQTILSLIDKLRRAEKLVEALEFYASNKGLTIDFKDNVFRSLDSDDRDFHGKRAREAIAEWRAKP